MAQCCCCIGRVLHLENRPLVTNSSWKMYREGNVSLMSLRPATDSWCFPSFQLPWIVDLAGVPIWCLHSGIPIPTMTQINNRLEATYVQDVPPITWPTEEFDCHGAIYAWRWAQKGRAIVAICVEGKTITVVVSTLGGYMTFVDFINVLR